MSHMKEKFDHISDFKILIASVLSMSDLDYQRRIWVNHEDPKIIDSYDDCTLYFLGDTRSVLNPEDIDEIRMSTVQRKYLTNLYELVDEYDSSDDRPEADGDIVEDPKWLEISEYAKEVYEVLTGDLDKD